MRPSPLAARAAVLVLLGALPADTPKGHSTRNVPGVPADIVSQIEGAIGTFFSNIWNGIVGFFGQIGQSITNLVVSIFQAPINAINNSWASFNTWASGFGPIAPLLVVLMLAAFVILAVFVLWLIVKLSVSEGEQTAEEAEEGV